MSWDFRLRKDTARNVLRSRQDAFREARWQREPAIPASKSICGLSGVQSVYQGIAVSAHGGNEAKQRTCSHHTTEVNGSARG